MVVIINLRFGVGWTSDRNGARRGAAPWGAAPYLGTLCLEVQITKSAWATQSRTGAWSYIFIYVLPNFTFITRLSRRGSYAFFSWCRSWVLWKKAKMNTAIPPRYRRILKKGDFNKPSVFSFFKKKTAVWNLLFQNRRKATCILFRCMIILPPHNGFFIFRWAVLFLN